MSGLVVSGRVGAGKGRVASLGGAVGPFVLGLRKNREKVPHPWLQHVSHDLTSGLTSVVTHTSHDSHSVTLTAHSQISTLSDTRRDTCVSRRDSRASRVARRDVVQVPRAGPQKIIKVKTETQQNRRVVPSERLSRFPFLIPSSRPAGP